MSAHPAPTFRESRMLRGGGARARHVWKGQVLVCAHVHVDSGQVNDAYGIESSDTPTVMLTNKTPTHSLPSPFPPTHVTTPAYTHIGKKKKIKSTMMHEVGTNNELTDADVRTLQ